MFLIHRSVRSRDFSLFGYEFVLWCFDHNEKSVKRLKQSRIPLLTGCLKNAWAGSKVALKCFYSSAKGKSPHLNGQTRNPLLVQLVPGCAWTQRVPLTVPSGPGRTTGATLPTKEESQNPFPGQYLQTPWQQLTTTLKIYYLGWERRALLQFTYGFGFSKELAGFWNKLSLSMDLWGHHFCLTADRELILLE